MWVSAACAYPRAACIVLVSHRVPPPVSTVLPDAAHARQPCSSTFTRVGCIVRFFVWLLLAGIETLWRGFSIPTPGGPQAGMIPCPHSRSARRQDRYPFPQSRGVPSGHARFCTALCCNKPPHVQSVEPGHRSFRIRPTGHTKTRYSIHKVTAHARAIQTQVCVAEVQLYEVRSS